MVGPAAKREAVAHLRGVLEMSERRASSLVAADRKMIRYRSRRPVDTELRARLRELANQRRRFGYRRLYILLRDEGEPSGINRIYRLYREEGLAVRKRRSRRPYGNLLERLVSTDEAAPSRAGLKWEPERQSSSRPNQTPAGHSISSTTSLPAVAVCASSTSSMT